MRHRAGSLSGRPVRPETVKRSLMSSTSWIGLGQAHLTTPATPWRPEQHARRGRVDTSNPLENLLRDIEAALQAHLFFLALVSALALPDMCAALESPDGRTSARQYQSWYRAHLHSSFPHLSPEDCYSLRCGVVHQGRLNIKGSKEYSRVVFSLPVQSGFVMHNCAANDILQFDCVQFCLDMANAVRLWWPEAKNIPCVIANESDFLRIRPKGLPGIIEGIPLIA